MEGLDRHFLPRRGHRRTGTARCHSRKRFFNMKDRAHPCSATALRRLRIGHDRPCGQDARAPGKPARCPRPVHASSVRGVASLEVRCSCASKCTTEPEMHASCIRTKSMVCTALQGRSSTRGNAHIVTTDLMPIGPAHGAPTSWLGSTETGAREPPQHGPKPRL